MQSRIKQFIFISFTTAMTCYAFAQSQQEMEKALSSVTVFSYGYNGFAAKKMPSQLLYETVLASKHATFIFEKIITDPLSTAESKAYAACGLWEKKQANKILSMKVLGKAKVSTLKADILRKEDLHDLLKRIEIYGCN